VETSHLVPGPVTITELAFWFAVVPIKPFSLAKTVAPLLTIIWLFALNAPISRSRALVHPEPAPVISTRLLLAVALAPTYPWPFRKTPPSLTSN
jgi:hypothetical protein